MSASETASMHRLALTRMPVAMVLTNPHLADNPIVFVNDAFTRLTGFGPEVSVGRNCRFLQGADTDPAAVAQMREAVRQQREVSVELLNYKADGTPFFNRVHLAPLHDDGGELQYFLGLQRAAGERAASALNAADEALREIHHRVKNHLSMVVGMIRMQSRQHNPDSVENYATLARRVETLQFLYQEMNADGTVDGRDTIALGAYISRIASAIAYLDGREGIRLNLDVADLHCPVQPAAQLGLLVSELLTNAYQHAFLTRPSGLIEVRLRALSRGTIRLEVADDGAGLPEGLSWPDNGGLGGKIVRSLLTGLNAKLDVSNATQGSSFTIDLPLDVEASVPGAPDNAAADREPAEVGLGAE